MIVTALIVGVLLIAIVLAYAATRPASMHIERSATINASADTIFSLVNDFHNWTAWSPWERLDPDLKRTYTGSHSGRGAVYEWEGNKKVGAGRMEITDTSQPTRVTIKLDFIRPFEGHNVTSFHVDPSRAPSASAGREPLTTVKWSMDGPSPFMARVMGIGKDFESGLANLRAAAEKS